MAETNNPWDNIDLSIGNFENDPEQEVLLQNGKHYYLYDPDTNIEIGFVLLNPDGRGMYNFKSTGTNRYSPMPRIILSASDSGRKHSTKQIKIGSKVYGEIEILPGEIIISHTGQLNVREEKDHEPTSLDPPATTIDTTKADVRDQFPSSVVAPPTPSRPPHSPSDDNDQYLSFESFDEDDERTTIDRIIDQAGLPTNSDLTNPTIDKSTPTTVLVEPEKELPQLNDLYFCSNENSTILGRHWSQVQFEHPQEEAIRVTTSIVSDFNSDGTIGFIIPVHDGFIFKSYEGERFFPKNKNTTYIIGRAFIPHPGISRGHFSIKIENGQLSIRDGGPEKKSSAGTQVQTVHYDISGNESKLLSDGQLKKVNFRQGEVGDCTLLGAITGILKHPYAREILLPLVTKGENGDWHIQFQGFKDTIFTVNESEVDDTPKPMPKKTGLRAFFNRSKPEIKPVTKRAKSDSLLIRILEKGYAKLIARFPDKFDKRLKQANIPEDEHTNLLNHGMGHETKARHHLLNIIGRENIAGYPFNHQYKAGDPMYKALQITKVLAEYIRHPESYILTTAQPYDNPKIDRQGRFVPNHCYAIGWVSKTHIEIINPWDTEKRRHIITMSDFFRYFGQIRGIKIRSSKIKELKDSRSKAFSNDFANLSTKEALKVEENNEPTMTIDNGRLL